MQQMKLRKLEITLETEEEIETLYSILNHSIICDYAADSSTLDLRKIRETIRETTPYNIHGGVNKLHEYLRLSL